MERGLSRKEFLRVGGAASAALVAGSALGVGRAAPTDAYSVASPDGNVEVVFKVERGRPSYSVGYAGRVVVEDSGMGFRLKGAEPLDGGFGVLKVEKGGFDETWRPVWGSSSEIRNRYNELSVRMRETAGPRRRLDAVFRVFDDGVGFRYAFPEQENLGDFVISEEDTEFRFAGDHTAWSIPANYDSYEYLYAETTLGNIGTLAEGGRAQDHGPAVRGRRVRQRRHAPDRQDSRRPVRRGARGRPPRLRGHDARQGRGGTAVRAPERARAP